MGSRSSSASAVHCPALHVSCFKSRRERSLGNERSQHGVALFGRNLSPKPSHNSGNLPLDCLFSVSPCSPTVRRGGRESGLASHDVKYVCPGASPPPRAVGRFRPWHLDTLPAPSPHSCLLSGSRGDGHVTAKIKDWSPVGSPNMKLSSLFYNVLSMHYRPIQYRPQSTKC